MVCAYGHKTDACKVSNNILWSTNNETVAATADNFIAPTFHQVSQLSLYHTKVHTNGTWAIQDSNFRFHSMEFAFGNQISRRFCIKHYALFFNSPQIPYS